MITEQQLPLIALKDIVVFPSTVVPLFVSRKRSLKAVEMAFNDYNTQYILLTTQKSSAIEIPKKEDLYNIGIKAKIVQLIILPNDNVKLLVEAEHRVVLEDIASKNNCLFAQYKVLPDQITEGLNEVNELNHAIDLLIKEFAEYIKINKKINSEVLDALSDRKSPAYITNIIASHLNCMLEQKQKILETTDILLRAQQLISIIHIEATMIQADQVVEERVKKQVEKTQRDYYLKEKIQAIQKELGEVDEKSEIQDLEKKLKNLKLSEEAREKATNEIKKYKLMNSMSAEAAIIRNYLDTLLSMPWGKVDQSKIDIKRAGEILSRDHYGMGKVKERIIEHLAVLQRSKQIKGPVLCLVGPPGVGKTSLAKSIAEAIGRKYVKFALGGVRDEAELRGHRRTYLGSMPGRIVSLLKKAGTDNPLMLLDEIDKMGSDFRGDPAAVMLEVLDPEQNNQFVDHYLEVKYDLSHVFFITTANSLNLPAPLLDRMEVIRLSGYLEEEKLEIAKSHLLPKQLKANNLKVSEFSITDEAILDLIRYYTRESGVRNLEREIGALARKSLKRILDDKSKKSIEITSRDLEEFLGVRRYRIGLADKEDQIGTTTGLAYTDTGGDLLSIEAVFVPGKGEINATGKLGEVMKESTQAAFSFFRSKAENFGINYENYRNKDIHLHVPEGAIPKDGPSAGIAIFTTIVSLMTNTPVKRSIAMTGEITLRGKVLAIGGLREKLLAACRGGIKTVIIPDSNLKDLKDIPEGVKQTLDIIPVTNAEEVLKIALVQDVKT